MIKNEGIRKKLKSRISNKKSNWIEQAEYYENNKDWLDKSALIALKILRHLRVNNITQKDLAKRLDVSPQYVNKIVKGKENLSLETICKIERVISIILIEIPEYSKVSEHNGIVFSSGNTVSKNKASKNYNQEQDYNSVLEVITTKQSSLSFVA